MKTKNIVGLTNFQLKVFAIVCMLIDHVASILQPYVGEFYTAMRIVGRLAFPVFCFLIVEGFVHTSNRLRYALRLGLFCIISEPCFDLAFHQTWIYKEKQNVFFTLLIGFLTIWAIDVLKEKFSEKKIFLIVKGILSIAIIIVSCLLADWLMTDYGFRGVLFICVFYLFRNRAWVGMLLFAVINLVCGYRLTIIDVYGWEMGKQYLINFLIQDAAILAIFPMILYNGQKGRSMKMFFYLFYPVHLLILHLISVLI